jgi:hypothetical protein
MQKAMLKNAQENQIFITKHTSDRSTCLNVVPGTSKINDELEAKNYYIDIFT